MLRRYDARGDTYEYLLVTLRTMTLWLAAEPLWGPGAPLGAALPIGPMEPMEPVGPPSDVLSWSGCSVLP